MNMFKRFLDEGNSKFIHRMKSSKVTIRVPPVTCCPTQLLDLFLVNSVLVRK